MVQGRRKCERECEAYRPPRSKYSLCCLVSREGGGNLPTLDWGGEYLPWTRVTPHPGGVPTLDGGAYLGQEGTYLGLDEMNLDWGVPTMDGGITLPWGTSIMRWRYPHWAGWGPPNLEMGVPTLDRGVPTLYWGYLPWTGDTYPGQGYLLWTGGTPHPRRVLTLDGGAPHPRGVITLDGGAYLGLGKPTLP